MKQLDPPWPLTFDKKPAKKRVKHPKKFNLREFYLALCVRMAHLDKNWKEVAAETNVSASTLSRMRDSKCPDGPSLAVLAAWADLDIRKYVKL